MLELFDGEEDATSSTPNPTPRDEPTWTTNSHTPARLLKITPAVAAMLALGTAAGAFLIGYPVLVLARIVGLPVAAPTSAADLWFLVVATLLLTFLVITGVMTAYKRLR